LSAVYRLLNDVTEGEIRDGFVADFSLNREWFGSLQSEATEYERVQTGLKQIARLDSRDELVGAVPTTYGEGLYAMIR
jgi:hypothetical protein